MFELSGNRTYVRGTDFYRVTQEFSQKNCPEGTVLKQLIFRKFTGNQCELTFTEPASDVVCQGQFALPTGTLQPFWWIELPEAVIGRNVFDEDSLVASASISPPGNSILMEKPPGNFGTIEVIVALTKKLHNQSYPLQQGKWVFAQLNLSDNLPIDYKQVEVRICNVIQQRFSVSSIDIDNRLYGQIRFIVGEP
ncbi:hypothetical protein [Rheinheimera sp.]|uniref:hypothetical protein n=1 Tax=Rheinheimera sp. TaxID=1869214 RepID=UPI00307D581C